MTPSPTWVKAADKPEAYDAVDYFIRTILAPTGAHVRLLVSGDLHHYARYSGADRELITCGGGGAYLLATHTLPERAHRPAAGHADPQRQPQPGVRPGRHVPGRQDARGG